METTIRVVSRWLRSGLVADEGDRLVVKDAGALQERAGGAME